ncbi:MAG: GNAT family N-acetyltransferase [Chloroflexota bacterium]
MQLIRFEDPEDFAAVTGPYLAHREAEHNLMLGITGALKSGHYQDPYMAMVEHDDRIYAVALRTPPHALLLSLLADVDTEAVSLDRIALDVAERFGPQELSGVNAPRPVADAFANRWEQISGRRRTAAMDLRIYRLDHVVPPQRPAPGSMRPADESDRSLLVDWMVAFGEITPEGPPPRAEAEQNVDRFLDRDNADRGLYLWEVDGQPVAMAGHSGPTPSGMRVNAVYTPPDLRGRGYASALVAALSEHLLASGRRFCFLYTDLSNPTSNSIYQKIGYQPVIDVVLYKFPED